MSGSDDSRLKWSPDRCTVKVEVAAFITGDNDQTLAGRRKRFSTALEQYLQAAGWEKALGKLNTYKRRQQHA